MRTVTITLEEFDEMRSKTKDLENKIRLIEKALKTVHGQTIQQLEEHLNICEDADIRTRAREILMGY